MSVARRPRPSAEPRRYTRGSASVTVVRRPTDSARRKQLVRLLALLLDKPDVERDK